MNAGFCSLNDSVCHFSLSLSPPRFLFLSLPRAANGNSPSLCTAGKTLKDESTGTAILMLMCAYDKKSFSVPGRGGRKKNCHSLFFVVFYDSHTNSFILRISLFGTVLVVIYSQMTEQQCGNYRSSDLERNVILR